MTCSTCKFWKNAHTSPVDLSECRRHAPVATGGMHCEAFTIWPKAKAGDWCGDHEPKVDEVGS